ncbi:Hypothetical predicted protein [Paramuricea clavata]|uniref:Uncharacterized protein n=1 Tax=Paramuricea clavata TaxID=317549 RepID=A0A6S7GD15_PARCT|nr:Hypothetical predicted protein [Paramuricea clavata]
MATGRVSESSANLSQNLAESLLDFVNDHSSSIWETTNTKQTEPILLENSKDLSSDNNNDFEVKHSLIQCDGSRLLQHLQLNSSRLLWKGSLEMLNYESYERVVTRTGQVVFAWWWSEAI